MTKKIDIFKVPSTSEDANLPLTVGDVTYTILQLQAIVGKAYARAAQYKNKTNKHEAWRKARQLRDKVNTALEETYGENTW